jgi:3-hydroxyacyl-[acyl-carrier-protein] dehydratase
MPPITHFIPQRPPMVMIDDLIEPSEASAKSTFRILPENIFVEAGKFTEPGLIENIAQTAAAMVGHQCTLQKIPVPIGFIAAVKDLKINFTPSVLSTIRTKITITHTVMDITIIEGKVEQSGELVCTCEMKIVIKRPSL